MTQLTKSGQAGVQIEVTPAMIEAASEILCGYAGDLKLGSFQEEALFRELFAVAAQGAPSQSPSRIF